MLKITVKSLKSRNPLVLPSLLRKAGPHMASGHARRQAARRALQRELKSLEPSPPRAGP